MRYGLVQARNTEATQGISKKRKVSTLEEKLKPGSNKKKNSAQLG